MVDYDGRVHLIDFGVARLWKAGQVTDTFPMGTPGYAAPEQYGTAQSGPATDIYALGATLYRTLTAVDPEPAGAAWTPLRDLVPACSTEMERILQRCLEPVAAQRYHTAAELMDDLVDLQRARYPEMEVPPLAPAEGAVQAPAPRRGVIAQIVTGLAWTTVACLFSLLWLNAILPHGLFYHGTRGEGQATKCKYNLKNIGTALEMYSTDNDGRFPPTIALLTPNYLKTIPSCPSIGVATYVHGYAAASNPETYTVVCQGNNHANVGYTPDHPQYTSTQGLLER